MTRRKRQPRDDDQKREVGRPSLFPGKVRDRNSSYAFTQATHDKIDEAQAILSTSKGVEVSRTDAAEWLIDAAPLPSRRKAAS